MGPDFVERQTITGRHPNDVLIEMAGRMRPRNVELMRVTLIADKSVMVMEGWLSHTADQGPEPTE